MDQPWFTPPRLYSAQRAPSTLDVNLKTPDEKHFASSPLARVFNQADDTFDDPYDLIDIDDPGDILDPAEDLVTKRSSISNAGRNFGTALDVLLAKDEAEHWREKAQMLQKTLEQLCRSQDQHLILSKERADRLQAERERDASNARAQSLSQLLDQAIARNQKLEALIVNLRGLQSPPGSGSRQHFNDIEKSPIHKLRREDRDVMYLPKHHNDYLF